MTGRVLLVMLMPMTMAAPHPHNPTTEETWTKITPGNSLLLLGSELREMPQYSAFLAIPDGKTWHAQVNPSKTQVEMWLYVAGGDVTLAPQGGANRGGGGAGRGRWRPRRRQSESFERSGSRRSGDGQRQAAQVAPQEEHNVVKTLCKLAVVGGFVAMTSSVSHGQTKPVRWAGDWPRTAAIPAARATRR
jgi:hypothetical protein